MGFAGETYPIEPQARMSGELTLIGTVFSRLWCETRREPTDYPDGTRKLYG